MFPRENRQLLLGSKSARRQKQRKMASGEVGTDSASASSVVHRTVEVITPEFLSQCLALQDPDGVLIIDARPFMAFNQSHVTSAHNVHCPPILKRRSGGTIPLENVIRCPKARGALLQGRYTSVVVYDEATSSPDELDPDSNLALVIKCLKEDARVRQLYLLEGGFSKFARDWPHLLSSQTSLCGNTEESLMAMATSSVALTTSVVAMRTPPTLCSTPQGLSFNAVNENGDQVVPSMDAMETADNRYFPGMDQGDPVEVLPWLYLGNAYHASQGDRLQELGISALLNVSSTVPISRSTVHNRFLYKHLSIDDTSTTDISIWFPEAISFIDLVHTSGGVVLVHCHAGISRSATICIAYLMYHQCLTLDQAHDYLKSRRSLISPNLNFMRQLLEYEGQLRDEGHLKTPVSSGERPGQVVSRPVTRGLSVSSSDPTSLHLYGRGMKTSMSLPLTPCSRKTGFVFDSTLLSHAASSPTINMCQNPLLSPS